jgi:hypothetical protein
MPSRRKVVKKSAPKVSRKVVKKSARKSVKKSARKSVPKSARKVVKSVAKKSPKKSVKKSVKKSRTSPKTRKYRVIGKRSQPRQYDVCIFFGVYPEDEDEEDEDDHEDEEQVNANALSDSAKALFSEKIEKECARGFYASSFLIKNIAITFQLDNRIKVTGTVDIDPTVEDDCGGTLQSWVEVVNDKSIWQWSYGPNNEYHVESNGKKYKLLSMYMC